MRRRARSEARTKTHTPLLRSGLFAPRMESIAAVATCTPQHPLWERSFPKGSGSPLSSTTSLPLCFSTADPVPSGESVTSRRLIARTAWLLAIVAGAVLAASALAASARGAATGIGGLISTTVWGPSAPPFVPDSGAGSSHDTAPLALWW